MHGQDARSDLASAPVVGAILLFGILSAALAILNVTSVPAVGLANEEAHFDSVLDSLGALQSNAEGAASGTASATASTTLSLGPAPSIAADLWGIFLATPARAAGALAFDPDHGNVTISHYPSGSGVAILDVGSATTRLPFGRLHFDSNSHFRDHATLVAENGAVVSTSLDSESIRLAPPVSVNVSAGVTHVTVGTRILTGEPASLGGTSSARVALTASGATASSPPGPNAERVVVRLETDHGRAWGHFMNATALDAGLVPEAGFTTTVAHGAGATGLDVVTWTIHGVGTGNDVRLVSSLTIFNVRVS